MTRGTQPEERLPGGAPDQRGIATGYPPLSQLVLPQECSSYVNAVGGLHYLAEQTQQSMGAQAIMMAQRGPDILLHGWAASGYHGRLDPQYYCIATQLANGTRAVESS